MKEGRFDRIQNIMYNRVQRVAGKISQEMASSKPFGKEPMSNKEKVYKYEEMMRDPLMVQSLRQSMGEAFDQYQVEMERLKSSYRGG